MSAVQRIALHKQPPLDALVATWLAQRYLCTTGQSEVVFFPPGHPFHKEEGIVWCAEPGHVPILDLGWPRKRLSFGEQFVGSATGRLWADLLNRGRPVPHLVDLVDAVHIGTLAGGDRRVPAAGAGLWNKLRATWGRYKKQGADDLTTYQTLCRWLDRYEAGLGLDAVTRIDWKALASSFSAEPGTYVLIMETSAPGGVLIGRTGALKRMEALPGYYGYIGSACAKTGLRGRQKWHLTLARELKLKWQVDFLRLRCSVREVWYTTDPFPLGWDLKIARLARECAVSQCVREMRGAVVPVAKFGSSDCSACPAHLAHFGVRPSFRSFKASMKKSSWPCHMQQLVLDLELR